MVLRAYYKAQERKCQVDKQTTRRERIDAALGVAGEAAETFDFSINVFTSGYVSVHCLTGRDVLREMSERPDAVSIFERARASGVSLRHSVIVGDVEFFQFLPAEEAALYGIF